jgi:hypothetical protein
MAEICRLGNACVEKFVRLCSPLDREIVHGIPVLESAGKGFLNFVVVCKKKRKKKKSECTNCEWLIGIGLG